MIGWILCALGVGLTAISYFHLFQALVLIFTGDTAAADSISASVFTFAMYWASGALCAMIGTLLIARRIPVTNGKNLSPPGKSWLIHHAALSYLIGVPQGQLIGPLIVGNFSSLRNYAAQQQLKSVLNFQLSITLYAFTASLLSVVVIGLIFLTIIFLFQFFVSIRAALKTKAQQDFVYPLSLKFLP